MICINCFNTKTSIVNSRPHKSASATWRRRACSQCSQRFTTYERPRLDESVKVVRDNDASSPFSLGKLTLSIADSFTHDKQKAEYDCLPLAETVEQMLVREVPQPSVHDIAVYTHTVLRRFDEVAALQYAARHGLVEGVRKRGRPSIRPTSL